jgi:predicted phage terminase large subunit-like protein
MSEDGYSRVMEELVRRELARRSYVEYLSYIYGKTWKRTKFSSFVGEKIQRFIEENTGHAYDILILESPPQHGKSKTVTEALPSWYLGRHPEKRVITVSYNEDTAGRFLRANKDKIKEHGQQLFEISMGKVDRADRFELKEGGSMISRGIMAGLTGNPADLMIIDDPIKNRQEADSETTRNSIWGEWLSSMKSRLSAGAKVILIMTPWHEDDLRARILATEQYVTHIRLPVEAEEGDPMGRLPGDPLCPEIGKGKKWLRQFKKAYLQDARGGSRAWSALYMCAPVTEGGNLVRRSWWQYYQPEETPSFGTECISVDAAFKGEENSDYVSIQVWGKRGNDYYLRYCCNEHLDFPATVRRLWAVRGQFPQVSRVYIEDKANGSAIIQTLQRDMVGVIPVEPMGGKVARVNAVSPAIETGHVFLPRGAEWLEDYLRQWSEFPAGKHDDMVDASSQALSKLLYAYGGTELPKKPERAPEEAFLSAGCYDPYGLYGDTFEEGLWSY